MPSRLPCLACGHKWCPSAPGTATSTVRCFFTCDTAKRNADKSIGVERSWQFSTRENPESTFTGSWKRSVPMPLLLALPVETFFHIIQYVSEIDVFSLRLACRALYKLLYDRKPPYNVAQTTIKDLRSMLLRESFLRGCDAERVGNLRKDLRMCSLCRISHSYQAFTRQELAEPPEKRLCYCKTRAIRLCPHQSYTFNELQSLPYFQTTYRNKLQSQKYSICPHVSDQCSSPIQGSPAQIRPCEEGHCISWAFEISSQFLNEASLQDFEELIVELGGCFCPHIRPEAVWQCLTAERSLYQDQFHTVCERKAIRCAASSCLTQISWSRGFHWSEGPSWSRMSWDLHRRESNSCKVVRCFSIERPDKSSYLAQLLPYED